ncbi:MAG: copper amine oxidase N-terminal domain-containing protein [Bacillota bacterium]
MIIIRRLMVFFIALFLIGFYFGPIVSATFLSPGSVDDPLVTKKWVDNYILEKTSPIHDRTLILTSRVNTLGQAVEQISKEMRPTIILTVGSKIGLIDDQERVLDAAPFLISGRTLLPLRFVGEAFGVNFAWDKQSKTVTYPSAKGKVALTIGQKKVLIGDESLTLDVEARIVAGRTFVPLRFIGESLGAEVNWHSEAKKVEIR